MKVLTISTDRKIFEVESPSAKRMIEYGQLFEEFSLIIFSLKKSGLKVTSLSPRVKVYPTASFSRAFYLWDALLLGFKIIRTNHYGSTDFVSVQDPFETGLVGWCLVKWFKLNFQVQIHTDPFSPYFGQVSWLNWFRQQMMKITLPRADIVRVVSERVVLGLHQKFPKLKAIVKKLPITSPINNSQNLELELDLSPFSFIALVTSRLEKEKNLPLLIKTWSLVAAKIPTAGLIIAGVGREEKRLKELVKKFDLEKKVIFTGWQKSLEPLYVKSQCFISTSYYEGYGLALLEAARAGLPVISSEVGLVGEILIPNESVLAYKQDDVRSLSESIIKVAEDPVLRKKLGAQAKVAAEKHNLTADNYLAQYVDTFKLS